MAFSNKTGGKATGGNAMACADVMNGKDEAPRQVDGPRPGSRDSSSAVARSSSTEAFVQTAKFGGR